MSGHAPRFDLPNLTAPASETLARLGVTVPPTDPMPELIEPEHPRVTNPVNEPMVPVQHRRIRVLANYWHAGWENARSGCWLRQGAMERLAAVADNLPQRWGLAVFDAWRPLPLQSELYDSAYADPELPPGFVSVPVSDPEAPPPHLTGGTVDVGLTIDGIALAPGAGFDDFTDRARADRCEDLTGADRDVRRLLYWSMRAQDFVLLDCEWWHFEHGTRRWAAITGQEPKYGPAEVPLDR